MNVDWDYPRLDPALTGDIDFPQRAFIGDTALVADALRDLDLLPTGATHVTLSNVWYVPGRTLCAVYEQAGARMPTVFAVDFAGRATAPPTTPSGPHWSRRISGHVRTFPDDPGLPLLASLIEGDRPPGVPPQGSGWKLLSYLPGSRCTIGLLTPQGRLAAVGKMQSGVAATHARMTTLRDAADGRFGLAEPLACDAARSTRWEGAVPGERLDRLEPHRRAEGLRYALQALAALHGTPLPDLPSRGAEIVFGRVARKVAKRVRMALPSLEGAAEDLCATLAARMGDLEGRPAVTLHGDFHTANILFDGDRPGFIDLDELASGDPAYDLALFASRLLLVGLLRPDQMDDLADLAASVPSLYREGGGQTIPDEVFAWYVSTLLLGRQVKTCIRHSIPGLERICPVLTQWANAVARERRVDPRLFATR